MCVVVVFSIVVINIGVWNSGEGVSWYMVGLFGRVGKWMFGGSEGGGLIYSVWNGGRGWEQ